MCHVQYLPDLFWMKVCFGMEKCVSTAHRSSARWLTCTVGLQSVPDVAVEIVIAGQQ